MLSTLRLSPSPFGAVPILLLPSRSSSRLGSISESRQSRRATSTAPCLSHLLRHRATSAAPLRDCDSFNPRSRGPKKGGKLPVVASKKKLEKVVNPLFEKHSKQFGIGGALPPKGDPS